MYHSSCVSAKGAHSTQLQHPELVTVVDSVITNDALIRIRDRSLLTAQFKGLCTQIARSLALYALDTAPTVQMSVQTPQGVVLGEVIDQSSTLLVPVLRAGQGLLEGFSELVPNAPVAMVGLRRDEATLRATWYLDSMPSDLSGVSVYILDPMLATGGSVGSVAKRAHARDAKEITVVSILTTAVGIDHLHDQVPAVRVVAAAIDAGLDDNGYILPGLGDAGDRLHGTLPT